MINRPFRKMLSDDERDDLIKRIVAAFLGGTRSTGWTMTALDPRRRHPRRQRPCDRIAVTFTAIAQQLDAVFADPRGRCSWI
jgi:hypothetical protein